MKGKVLNFMKKISIVIVCLFMIFNAMPLSSLQVSAAGEFTNVSKVSDPNTMDSWQWYFGKDANGNYSTVNAGAIWGDKSVFTNDDAFNGKVTMSDESSNFLVALSALSSNKEIVGYSALPTDTMLVLDLSNSMSNENVTAMVRATNQAIEKLQNLNPNNRIGVVLYSGNNTTGNHPLSSATVVLPLSRYTTDSTSTYNGVTYEEYLEYENDSIRTARTITGNRNNRVTTLHVKDVLNENATVNESKSVSGATYIQSGMWKLWNEFKEKIDDNDTTIKTGVQAGTTRLPVMVLMSDGAPTAATTSYNNVNTSNSGNGSTNSATDQNAFFTQLTNSWVKAKVEEGYGRGALFYTLGLGVRDNGIAESVLDPEESTNTIKQYWESFLGAQNGASVTVGNKTVTKDSTVKERDYVDRYFEANNTAQLVNAFESIVEQIIIQSKYYPTLIEAGKHDLGGYITFTDDLDEYMVVKDVKGILVNDTTLYTGSMLAKEIAVNDFMSGAVSSNYSDLTEKEQGLLDALTNRLGCSEDQAKTALTQALRNRQIYYNSDTDYSNYVGWYANADGSYAGYWDGSDPLTSTSRPTSAESVVKCYGFFGTVGDADTYDDTDMLYITVQVKENLITGRQSVVWKIPASLIPTITYNIEFEGSSFEDAHNIKMTVDEELPIRLIFEEGLDNDINELNIVETLGNKNRNADGTYSFYTNNWEYAVNEDGLKPDEEHVATVMDFEPSFENERYYYESDTLLYVSDGNGGYEPVVYEGQYLPNQTYYHKHTVFTGKGTPGASAEINKDVVFTTSPLDVIYTDVYRDESTNNWYIKKGTTHRVRVEQMEGGTFSETIEKSSNTTGTIHYSHYPTITLPSNSEVYHADIYLGNNGKLTVLPAQGIKLTKSIDTIVPGASNQFLFDIALKAPSGVSLANSYEITIVDANGDITKENVSVVNGVMTVEIHAGQSVYVTGLPTGTTYTITEQKNSVYKVKSVNGDESVKVANGVVDSYILNTEAFVNTPHTGGNLIVRKTVTHPYGSSYVMPKGIEFTVVVNLGTENANKEFDLLSGEKVKTDGNGNITLKLEHSEAVGISGIPHGTVYSVVETNLPVGFTLDTSASEGLNGTIENDVNSAARLVNNYNPADVTVGSLITHTGTKELTGRVWLDTDEFTFELQRFNGTTWQKVSDDALATVNINNKDISFTSLIQSLTFSETGVYQYRVIETAGTIGGITYDPTEKHFDITVTDTNMDGKLEISKVDVTSPATMTTTTDDAGNITSYNIDTDFNNSYAPKGSAEIEFNIAKDVISTSGVKYNNGDYSEFEFGLYDADGHLVSSFYVDAAGNANKSIVYSAADLAGETSKVYKYMVREIVPTGEDVVDGMIYSTHEYLITVTLIDNLDGTVRTEITVVNESDKEDIGKTDVNGTEDTSDDEYVLAYTNTYDPEDTSVQFSGTKTLTGKALTNGAFTFELYKANENFELVDADATTELIDPFKTTTNVGTTFAFETITYDKVGDYYYVIKERNTNVGGVGYDSGYYEVIVTVTDVDGKLQSQVSYVDEAGLAVANIGFVNTYTVQPTDIYLSGTKTLTGKVIADNMFTFNLYETDATFSTVGKEAISAKNVSGSFSYTIEDKMPGTYYFVLEEANAGQTINGVTYDNTHYHITVIVSDNGDGTSSSAVHSIVKVSHTASGVVEENVNELSFTNAYTVTDNTGLKFEANKNLEAAQGTDRELEADEFTFVVYQTSDDYNITGLEPIDTATNNGEGKIEFDSIYYTSNDVGNTYYYVIAEKDAGKTINGVTYTNVVYRVIVEVTDNGDGTIKTNVTYSKHDGQASVTAGIGDLLFTNKYNAKAVTTTVEGTKSVIGRDWPEIVENKFGGFTFNLYSADKDYKVLGDKPVDTTTVTRVDTGKNYGSFVFGEENELTFDAVGTYYFVAKEEIPEEAVDNVVEGLKYDSDVYNIKITVTDNGKGQFVATKEIVVKGTSEKLTNLSFVNEDVTVNETLTLSGTKTVTGRPLTTTYTFELYEADYKADGEFTLKDANPETSDIDPLKTTTNVGQHFSFDAITYEETGVYYYVVKERIPKDAENNVYQGITYDTTVYNVIVTVEFASDGQTLNAVATYEKVKGTTEEAATSMAFTNKYDVYNKQKVSFEVSKELVGKTLTDGNFSMNVYETNSTYNTKDITPTIVSNKDGKFTFTTADERGVGTYYFVVSEVNAGETINGITYDDTYYHVSITVTDDGLGNLVYGNPVITKYTHTERAISTESVTSMKFVNTYTAIDDTGVTFKAQKTLTGRDLVDGEFTFNLYSTDSDWNIASDAHPIQTAVNVDTDGNKATGEVKFDTIKYDFSNVGESFYYVITEKYAGETINGVTYTTVKYRAKVTVVDDGDGTLSTNIDYSIANNSAPTSGGISNIVFENKYGVTDEARGYANIEAFKLLSGNKALDENMFSFELKGDNINTQTKTNGEDGKVTFDQLEYDKNDLGTHTYTISEVNGGQTIDGITYDNTVYTVEVTVSDNLKGGLNVVTKYYLNKIEIPANEVEFHNTYKATGTVSVDFNAEKTLVAAEGTDRELIDSEFAFYLYKANDQYAISGDPVQIIRNKANGTVDFQPLTFSTEGTYYYVIKELIPVKAVNNVYHGITYDHVERKVKIVVSDNGVGGYKAVTEINGERTTDIRFVNNYNANSVKTTIDGKKVLNGRLMKDKEFTFELYDATYDNGFVQGEELLEVQNNVDGSFKFEDTATTDYLEFSKVGTYYFIVKETNGGETINGVTYDDSYYEVVVTVTDDGLGQLVANTTMTRVVTENEETFRVSADAMKFYNGYVPVDKTGIQIKVSKELIVPEGMTRKLEAGEFEFEIFMTGPDYVIGKDAVSIRKATNDANGNVAFMSSQGDRKYFKEAGTYYFSIREVRNHISGIKYDTETIEVEVNVVDDLNGNLIPTVKYHVNNKETSKPTFTNEYNPESAEVTISGTKHLEGRKLKDEEFTFELWQTNETYELSDSKVESVTNNKDGLFSFTSLTFDKVGTYYYVVKEYKGVSDGVTYDESTYEIIVEVKDDEKGSLYAEVTVNDEDETEIEFNNKFTAASIDVDLVAIEKILNNKSKEEMSLEGFVFKLESEHEEPVVAVTDADGKAKFGASFRDEDAGKTFTFKLSEVDTGVDHMTYDKSTYIITVKVEKDDEGILHTTLLLDGKEVEMADVTFTNTYNPPKGVDTGDNSMASMFLTMNISAFLVLLFVFSKKRRKA